MIIIILPATLLKVLWLILLDIYVPKITPIKLDRIRANAAAIKTYSGFPVSADKSNVAICVLSPNSATKTAVNVAINVWRKPLEDAFSSFERLSLDLLDVIEFES